MKYALVSSACALLLAAGASAQATASEWGQCGGQGWTGPTACPAGWGCVVSNQYYSQCLQGAAPAGPPATTASAPVGGGGVPPPTPTASAPGSSTTLIPGNSFIRAVEAPNFHKYLQSEKLGTAGDAVLGDPSTASQFQITGGQLIQLVPDGTKLYAVVESRSDPSVMKLKVSWSTTPSTSGTFVFSGDTVEWSTPAITRPQNNAWLVCPDPAGNLDLFVNLGAYSYMTPAGCADETIHAYTGATATA
ncbi:hypothetical protein BXZ70DRAFT_581676 [Cristinia sonorae]|uniref:CBM1 domain-containing protein n=1 Tax=Cristinia sonorae TaxID=1940300 RepID=A0A8K0UHC1_9AGAR|nr:hypothetical protein BXZ70DRAFT_581676 [Cristinia sonorae]